MKLVLDTNALWHAELRRAIREAHALGATRDGRLRVILPSVAYAERLRQLVRQGLDVKAWNRDLDRLGAVVEPFTAMESERVAERALDDDAWTAYARDALIAAHVHGERIGVSADRGPVWTAVRSMLPVAAAEAVREIVAPLE